MESLEDIIIYNPECVLNDAETTIMPETAVIHGYANSTAQGYAEKYNRKFVALPCEHPSYTVEFTKEATCFSSGIKTYTCDVCGESHVEEIPQLHHTDKGNDGYCDYCGTKLESNSTCSHLCHKTGFLGFIWKIANLFNKLFRINQYCTCGAKHW